jgi:hypothetical protein
MKILRLFSILIIVSALMLTACASSDTTKVTIYFAKNGHASLEQQKLPLIDRFLNLFSSRAYAQHHNPANTDYYFLWVTADDIDGVYSPMIPGTETSISLEVPNGNNRLFTILSLHSSSYNYIGQEVANLSGGDAAITVNMYPCLNDISIPPLTQNYNITLTWTFDSSLVSEGFLTFRLYRSCIGDDPACGYTGNVIEVDPTGSTNGPKEIFYNTYTDMYQLAQTSPNPQMYFYFLSVDSLYSPNGGLPVPANIIDYFNNYPFIAVYIMASGQFIYSLP